MKISVTYRFIASVLALAVLIGVSFPSGLHAKSLEECEAMEEMHKKHNPEPDEKQEIPEHAEDCPMSNPPAEKAQHSERDKEGKKHHGIHDLGFACACDIDEAPIKTEAQIQFKTKVPVLTVVQILAEIHSSEPETNTRQITVSDAYSPPPIYLANESFLN